MTSFFFFDCLIGGSDLVSEYSELVVKCDFELCLFVLLKVIILTLLPLQSSDVGLRSAGEMSARIRLSSK